MMNVNATPNGTRMMWNPSVKAICCRAGSSWEGSPAASAAWAAAHDPRLADVISSPTSSSHRVSGTSGVVPPNATSGHSRYRAPWPVRPIPRRPQLDQHVQGRGGDDLVEVAARGGQP